MNQTKIHEQNYIAFTRMLARKDITEETRLLLQEELDRNERLFLKYSENDPQPLIDAGIKAGTAEDGKIDYTK